MIPGSRYVEIYRVNPDGETQHRVGLLRGISPDDIRDRYDLTFVPEYGVIEARHAIQLMVQIRRAIFPPTLLTHIRSDAGNSTAETFAKTIGYPWPSVSYNMHGDKVLTWPVLVVPEQFVEDVFDLPTFEFT